MTGHDWRLSGRDWRLTGNDIAVTSPTQITTQFLLRKSLARYNLFLERVWPRLAFLRMRLAFLRTRLAATGFS